MIYPTITQYIETLSFANGCFNMIDNIELLRDSYSQPIYSAGITSVVFKVVWHGELYAMKLYTSFLATRDDYFKELSDYFILNPTSMMPWFKYYSNEISVYVGDGKFGVFPVLMLEWIEGELLSTKIHEICNLGNVLQITDLTNRLLSFTIELSSKEFTHVDLKCDNIVLRDTGDIILIDIDAMFIPDMCGRYATEKGTIWYQHPLRSEAKYSRHLSDYPIVIIISSMIILEKEPILLEKYCNGENLLFDPFEIYRGKSKLYDYLRNKYSEDNVISNFLDLLKSKSPRILELDRILKIIYYLRGGCHKQDDVSFFDDYTPYYEGVAAVRFSGKWRFVTSGGVVSLDEVFDECKCFSEGFSAVRIDKTWYLLDKNMNRRFSCECEEMGIVRQGLVAVKKNGLWGYYNTCGQIVIDHIYELARPFMASGEAHVRYNGIDTKINVGFLFHR